MKNIALILVIIIAKNISPANAQTMCDEGNIQSATNFYQMGKFADCISSIKPCLDQNGFSGQNKIQALEYMAMCYLAVDSFEKADIYIKRLLINKDDFEPATLDPVRFKVRVALVKKELRSSMTSSVSKKMENAEHAPATIQVITAQDIRDRGYTDLISLFNDLPGFSITSTFGSSQQVLDMRGDRANAYTTHILFLVDGIEDNELYTNGAFISKQYPISNIKKVEVIYGPSSTMYGANAFSGVINVVTKDAEDMFGEGTETNTGKEVKSRPALNVIAGAGSYNSHYVDGTLGLKTKNNVSFTVTGRVYQSDGIDLSSYPLWNGTPSYPDSVYKANLTKTVPIGSLATYTSGGLYSSVGDTIVPTSLGIRKADSLDKAYYKNNPKFPNASVFKAPLLDFDISSKLLVHDFQFGFQYWNKNEGMAGDLPENIYAINSAYSNWQIRSFNLYSRYDKSINEKLKFSTNLYYRYYDYGDNSRVGIYSGFGNGGLNGKTLIDTVPGFTVINFGMFSSQVGSEVKALYKFDEQFDILAGAEFRSVNTLLNELSALQSPTTIYGYVSSTAGGNSVTNYTTSGYLTGSYNNAEKYLNISMGGRIDNNRFRETAGYGTVFNPRFSIVWYPSAFVFKAIYSSAFLDAPIFDKFITTEVPSHLFDNPELKPGKVNNYEITARYKFPKKSFVEMDAYFSNYSSLEATATVTEGGITSQKFLNIGKSNVKGLTAVGEYFLDENIALYANLSLTDAQTILTKAMSGDSTSVRTADIPYVTANVGINAFFLQKRLQGNIRTNIVGDRPEGVGTSVPTSDLTKIPAFGIVNCVAGYKINRGLYLNFAVNNVFNTLYYSPGLREEDNKSFTDKVPQALRNFQIKLTANLVR